MKPKLIALGASLRNARWGNGVKDLLDKIKSTDDLELFNHYVKQEAKIHFEQFLEAGRKDKKPFDEIYKNLRKVAGKSGLCNSEVGMAAGLWGAWQVGCDIEYIPLSSYFSAQGEGKNLDKLKKALLQADGLLLCTPVYFGDRSSIASDFIEFIRRDSELVEHLKGKPVGGVAVGAKRNGGQETTLIYQLIEMTALGMFGVGNDSETTAQYGGTIVAGDVGTAADDGYGINTAMGVGRRLARIILENDNAKGKQLKDKLRVMFWVLQDKDGYAQAEACKLSKLIAEQANTEIFTFENEVARCIACDICPIQVGPDEEYRCIIKRKNDEFVLKHKDFLDWDVIVPVVFSPKDRDGLHSIYQRFIERTRYLRRGDYFFTDCVIIPLVFEELGANEYLNIRMLTSLIRHHTIVSKPVVGYLYDNKLLNEKELINNWKEILHLATKQTIGRISSLNKIKYNPVGYILSVEKDSDAEVSRRREVLHNDREQRQKILEKKRIE